MIKKNDFKNPSINILIKAKYKKKINKNSFLRKKKLLVKKNQYGLWINLNLA